MAKFRKKPVVVDAVQWTGANIQEVAAFLAQFEQHLAGFPEERCAKCVARIDYTTSPFPLVISTLDGPMIATAGDWVIRGVYGEFSSCKADIFAATYDAVTTLETRNPGDPEIHLNVRKAVTAVAAEVLQHDSVNSASLDEIADRVVKLLGTYPLQDLT